MFIHTLDTIPQNWYTQLELRQETIDKECLTKNYITTFSFEYEDIMVENALQLIKDKVFEGIEETKDCLPNWALFSKKAL